MPAKLYAERISKKEAAVTVQGGNGDQPLKMVIQRAGLSPVSNA